MNKGDFTRRWVVASTLGWLAGFVLVVLLALVVELLAGTVQVVVGLGMGAGVGFFQGRLLRPGLDSPWAWTRTSAVGMGAPFLVQDLVRALGVDLPSSLWIYVPLGGLLTAFLQRNLLVRISDSPGSWLLPCFVGWALPAVVIAAGDGLGGPAWFGGVLSLAGMFLGGAMLGLVTGKPLRDLLRGTSA